MALINQSDVEARLQRTLTAEEASAFTTINAAAQAYVEQIIGSSVEQAVESTRYYDGGVQHLAIDPCTDVTAVKYVDDDTTVEYTFDTTDYTLEPINDKLKTMIRHRPGKLTTGINNVAVLAKFSIYGDSKTLAIVKNALIGFLVSEVQNSSNIKRESIEGYSIEFATTESMAALSPINYLFPEV